MTVADGPTIYELHKKDPCFSFPYPLTVIPITLGIASRLEIGALHHQVMGYLRDGCPHKRERVLTYSAGSAAPSSLVWNDGPHWWNCQVSFLISSRATVVLCRSNDRSYRGVMLVGACKSRLVWALRRFPQSFVKHQEGQPKDNHFCDFRS